LPLLKFQPLYLTEETNSLRANWRIWHRRKRKFIHIWHE